MPRTPRTGLLVTALLAALLSLTFAGPAAADDGSHYRPPAARDGGPLSGDEFVGLDGRKHKTAPLLVNGKHGTRYYGEEFNAACGYGKQFAKALVRLRSLARLIRESGRKVVFTVGPNKSAVNLGDLRTNRLPHGSCDRIGLQQQNDALDRFQDKSYLPMRRPLATAAAASKDGRDLYWPIDTHWTSLATAKYAVALADRLKPKVASVQRFRKGKETIQTDISTIGLYPENYETGPALYSTTKVKMTPPNKDDPFDWRSRPAKRTIGGTTLLIGDSFTYRGLFNLRPLFRHGMFRWIQEDAMADTALDVPKADTVVLEVVQRWLPISPLTKRSFKKQVAAALAAHDG
jgi:hypothetical protein